MYSITCIQRPPKGGNKSGLLKQVVFKCRFYYAKIERGVVSEKWSLKAEDCLIQVVSNTDFTVFPWFCSMTEHVTSELLVFTGPTIM